MQFRPPIGKYTVELCAGKLICDAMQCDVRSYLLYEYPFVSTTYCMFTVCSGLIDPGETPGKAALRELEEETGYKGTIVQATGRGYM